jgi:hypothetical protein
MYTTVSILDEVAALVWAREKQMALVPESLDKPALFKITAR